MATALATQSRAAGSYTSVAAPLSKLGDRELKVAGVGLSAPALADTTLQLKQFVEANDAATGNTGWYPVYGPDDWHGGIIGTKGALAGQPIPPGFTFSNPMIGANSPAQRIRLRVDSNKTATWGYDVTDNQVSSGN